MLEGFRAKCIPRPAVSGAAHCTYGFGSGVGKGGTVSLKVQQGASLVYQTKARNEKILQNVEKNEHFNQEDKLLSVLLSIQVLRNKRGSAHKA